MQTIKEAKPRTEAENLERAALVTGIINKVRAEGDAALAGYNEQFDGCVRPSLRVTQEEIRAAYEQVSEEMIADMQKAAANIRAFAEAQRASMHELSGFGHGSGAPDHPGFFVPLLCAGRQLSAVQHRADAGDPGKGSRRRAGLRLLPGSQRNGSHRAQDARRNGYRRRG